MKEVKNMKEFFKQGQTVLFQGDSITDWGRDREDITSLSEGYPGKVAAIYNTLFPNQHIKFVNKGVSGDRSIDVLNRYEADIKAIKPDFISILVGINDTWRRYDSNETTTAEQYESNYRQILKNIKRDFPQTKIMLIEPYVLYSLPDRASWRVDLDPKIQVVRKLAKEYADYYLPLDGIFASLCANTYTQEQISEDGVHPIDLGHSIIAYEYLKLLQII